MNITNDLKGKLWGVGVGPGDPELLTLKAIRVISQADVILVPDSCKSDNVALAIAGEYVKGKEIRKVSTPMIRDQSALDRAFEEAADTVSRLLDQGKQAVFLTLGDPCVYSTYMYIHERVRSRGYAVEVVPGIPSFCAAAARLNQSLCQGSEPLLILPASHNRLELLDVPANKVLMKAGSAILELKQTLLERGELEKASMVENCTMENERVYPHMKDLETPSGYFSLVIVKE